MSSWIVISIVILSVSMILYYIFIRVLYSIRDELRYMNRRDIPSEKEIILSSIGKRLRKRY